MSQTLSQNTCSRNRPDAVLAVSDDSSALLALQVVGEGDDPAAVADEVGAHVQLSERRAQNINELPAVTAVGRLIESGQELALSLTWIAKDGLIYQILGATTPRHWEERRPVFEATAATFHTTTEAELQQVVEDRLRLVAAKPGETVTAVAERGQSQWSAERTAAANAMEPSEKPGDGVVIKVSRKEKYGL